MAITKAKKEEVVAKVNDAIADAASVVFVHFKGLSMESTTAMRRALQQDGVSYMVAKKTLIKHALKSKGYQGTLPELPGELAIAWSSSTEASGGDPTLAARDIYEQGKKYTDALSIVGGIYEGTYQDAGAMNAIATIPPLPVLRGMFVNVINSPIQSLVIALNQVAEKTA
jgi:large subunit ribosomal protein L10